MKTQVFVLSLSIACGGGDAEEKCEAFKDLSCDAIEEHCDLGAQGSSREDCMAAADSTFDCTKIIAVAKSYEDCLDDIQAQDECPYQQPLPTNCEDVLIFE